MVRELRRLRGLSQTELAETLNVGQSAVSRWEQGRDVPNIGAQRKLREVFEAAGGATREGWLSLLVRRSKDLLLIDRGLCVRAFSDALPGALGRERAALMGGELIGAQVDDAGGLAALAVDGFFDALLGSCRIGVVSRMADDVDAWFVELTPIVGSDGEPMMLASARVASRSEVETFWRAHPRGYEADVDQDASVSANKTGAREMRMDVG